METQGTRQNFCSFSEQLRNITKTLWTPKSSICRGIGGGCSMVWSGDLWVRPDCLPSQLKNFGKNKLVFLFENNSCAPVHFPPPAVVCPKQLTWVMSCIWYMKHIHGSIDPSLSLQAVMTTKVSKDNFYQWQLSYHCSPFRRRIVLIHALH